VASQDGFDRPALANTVAALLMARAPGTEMGQRPSDRCLTTELTTEPDKKRRKVTPHGMAVLAVR
jgi:hypothetical protein